MSLTLMTGIPPGNPLHLKKWLSDAGFEVKAVFDEDSFLPLRRDSQRAVIVAVKK